MVCFVSANEIIVRYAVTAHLAYRQVMRDLQELLGLVISVSKDTNVADCRFRSGNLTSSFGDVSLSEFVSEMQAGARMALKLWQPCATREECSTI